MKKYTLFLLLFTFGLFAQERFELKGHGVSFVKPQGWLTAGDSLFKENIDNFEWAKMKSGEMDRLKAAGKVVAFLKYDSEIYDGIIPTINLTTGTNPLLTFDQLKQMLANTNVQFVKLFDDFKIVSNPKEVIIDGKKALVQSINYTLKGRDGSHTKIKSRMLFFAKGKYHYSITLTEEEGKEDNMAFFDALVKTIKLSDK